MRVTVPARKIPSGGAPHTRRRIRNPPWAPARCDPPGHIVAAMLDGKATVKRLRRENGQVWLIPHNSAYQPIPGDGAAILGKVVAVLRAL